MRAITDKFRSYYSASKFHFNFDYKTFESSTETEEYWEASEASNSKIRLSKGYPVFSFKDLVALTARTTLWNREYEIFFRGQRLDYKDRNKKTVIYPAICRPELRADRTPNASIRTVTIEKRFERLQEFIKFYNRKKNIDFYENDYALIQHYEIMPTPLIDITQSLRVAATFALRNSDAGYLYIIGLPYPHGSISHFVDLGISLIKLQNAVPEKALRPRYQEGFLVGRLPFNPKKSVGDNLAKRIIGKFYLDNTSKNFWNEYFEPLPNEILFPEEDKYKAYFAKLLKEFDEKYGN